MAGGVLHSPALSPKRQGARTVTHVFRGEGESAPERPGLYSYNVFGVSRADLARIEALHAAYFNDLRAIVAGSEPVECVAVVNLHVFELRSR